MPKCLAEPLQKLEEQTSQIHDIFSYKIFKSYNNYKSQLASNKLLQLRRNLFVIYYTNPHQIEFIVQQLNAI